MLRGEIMKFLKDNTIVDINEAKPVDAEELLELFKKIGSESTYLIMDHHGLDLTVEEEKDYLQKANDSKTTKYFVARVDGKIVGDCGIKGHKSPKTKHNVDLGISILKEYWNKGLGTLLMEHTINYARITGLIKNIFLEVREDNDFAIKLYEKMGFKKVGVMPDKIYLEGKYYDEIIYLLQI
jgi:RimJ/RimL family protein N-acetyltransferase